MWEKLAGVFRLLWDSGKTLDSHGEAIKRSEISDSQILHLIQLLLTQNQQITRELETERAARQTELRHERELREKELQHEREGRAKDLENLELRLRLAIEELRKR